jgi:hypothetical protein
MGHTELDPASLRHRPQGWLWITEAYAGEGPLREVGRPPH